MSLTEPEFQDILNAEQHVDLAKLRAAARYGVPPSVRGDTWLYLLRVLSPDRTDELTRLRQKYATYFHLDHENPLSRRIAVECTRYYQRRLGSRLASEKNRLQSPPATDHLNSKKNSHDNSNQQTTTLVNHIELKAFTATCVSAIGTWLNRNRQAEYFPALVHICAPFVQCLKTEASIYYCLDRFMYIRDEHFTKYPLFESVSSWLNMLRRYLPDLYATFDEEEVDVRELAMAWLPNLFAQVMPLENLMRLWDAYLAMSNPFEHHRYVCLAILQIFRETLEELDQSEVRSMMLSLPPLEIPRLLAEANDIKSSIQTMNRVHETAWK